MQIKLILPGQGSFKNCVESLLKINGLKDTLNDFAITKKKPLFGICVGMQMFADIGFEETETKGIGMDSQEMLKKLIIKIINLNFLILVGMSFLLLSNSKLFKDIKENSHVYFVHSYKFVPSDEKFVSSKVTYSEEIVASIENNNLFGTQFHPEKSDTVGLKIIENFIKL